MRNTLKALAPLLALLALDSRAAVLPRTSEATMLASPLERGEAAYVMEGDGTATLYVGDDAGPLRVSDPAALRGVRTVNVPLGKYTVVPDANWSASASHTNGWYLTARGKARIVVTAVDGADITHLDYRSDAAASGLLPGQMHVSVVYLGASVVIECELDPYAGSGEIWDITPKRKAFGDADAATDLTAVRYSLIDEIGEFDFAHLRAWARDLYNGNRGEDWAAYPAAKPVRLAGKAVRFDAGGAYVARVESETNLTLRVNGYTAMEFTRVPGTTTQGSFTITSLDVPGDHATVTIGYTTSILGFDHTLLRVLTCNDLNEADWTYVDTSRCTVTADTVTITGCSDSVAFFKLSYDGIASEDIKVVFRSPVTFENALYLRGEDSKLYRITVNGGTITATEVEEQ